MGCCATRSANKYDLLQYDQFNHLNSLPSYHNFDHAYHELNLPEVSNKYLPSEKERIIFMIINMIRVRPRIFMQHINNFRQKCHLRQKAKNLIFYAEDVEQAIDLLVECEPIHPLILSKTLCQNCQDQANTTVYSGHISRRPLPPLMSQERMETSESEFQNELQSQRLSIGKYNKIKGVKEMIVDYYSREDLVITTLSEFIEVFISSLKKDQVFHLEIMNPQYRFIGLSQEYIQPSIATLRIFLAQKLFQ